MLMYPPGIVRRSPHSFPECISDFAFAGWIPVIGELQKLLGKGEYEPLRPTPLFESNFLQVTKRGELVDVHNRPVLVTLGIAATSPALLLPDVMIIARPIERPQGEPLRPKEAKALVELEMTRLIPLELVSLYLHDMGEQRLKMCLATGRVYYLKLCAPRGEERPLFARWLRLIYLLRTPPDSWASIPSWHTCDLRGRSTRLPPSQRLQPIREEEEPGATTPQPKERPASLTSGQHPSTRSVGEQVSSCITPVKRSRSTTNLSNDPSRFRAEVASPWMQKPSAERNQGQLSLAIPSGEQGGTSSRSQVGSWSQRGSCAGSRAAFAPGSPERSRASVGVGRSAVETASVGVGHSAVETASMGVGRSLLTTTSAAAGPSRPASPRFSGMGRDTEPGEKSRERSVERSHPSTEQGRSRSQSQRGSTAASRASMPAGSPERSRASVGVGRSAVETASVGVGHSAVETASVGVGCSLLTTTSAAAGPSRPASPQFSGMGRDMEPGEKSRERSVEQSHPSTEQGRSRSQSQRGSTAASRASVPAGSPERSRASVPAGSPEHSRASVPASSPERFKTSMPAGSPERSRASVPASSPERSRASVGVGCSAVETASVGVGRSLLTTTSAAVGPSRPASPRFSGMGREMEPGKKSRERSVEWSQAQLGHASPSTEQGRSRSQSQQGSTAASMPASSPEHSRASVGVGRSAVETASVGVGRSVPSTLSEAAGPSRVTITQPSGIVGDMEPGEKSRERSVERSQAQLGHTSPSTEQGRSRSQSQRGSTAASRAALPAGSPERSRASVPASSPERSKTSMPAGSRERSRASVPASSPDRSRASVPAGSPERSRASVPAGSPDRSRASVPASSPERSKTSMPAGSPERSRATVPASSPERSRASVGVGRSAVETASVGVGRSLLTTTSAAVGPSRPASPRFSGMGREMEPGEKSRERSVERSQAQLGHASPSTEQGRSHSQSQRGSTAASRASLPAGSPERSRASVLLSTPECSMAVEHSLPFTALAVESPSRLASSQPSGMDGQMESGRTHSRSPHGSRVVPRQSGATTGPSSHTRSAGSRAPSFPVPASCPVAAVSPERSQLSRGMGPSEVAQAMGPSGQRSQGSSPVALPGRQATRSRGPAGESSKFRARFSSSSGSHKGSSGGKGSESKGKLKLVLSSAKNRSSLTFMTLYSALSDSLDKLTGGRLSQRKSQEEAEAQLCTKSSKRVTISGVVEMSTLGTPEMSSTAASERPSAEERLWAGSRAAPDQEGSSLPRGQSRGSRATTAPDSPEKSRASVGLGRSAVVTGAAAAAGPSRQASVRPSGTGGEMESSKKSRESSVERSHSQLGHASPSMEQGRSRSRSPTGRPSQMGSSTMPRDSRTSRPSERSRISVAAGPSERSRISVAAGPSERSRISVAAGPSNVASVSLAVGPSELGGDQLSLVGRRTREHSKAESWSGGPISSPGAIRRAGTSGAIASLGIKGDNVSREKSEKYRASMGGSSPERSRMSVLPSSQERSRASVPPESAERSRVSVPPQSGERSRVSMPPESVERSRVSVPPESTGRSRVSVPPESAGRSRVSVPPESGERSRVTVSPEYMEKSRVSVHPESSGRSRASMPPGSAERSSVSVPPESFGRSRVSVPPESARRSRVSVPPESAEKSRVSVCPESAGRSRALVPPGSAERSRVSVAVGPSELSRTSVAVGPSEMATVSVAVGLSKPGSLSSARTPGAYAPRSPSKGRSRLIPPSSGARLGIEAGDVSLGRCREQSQAREEGGARSRSPLSQPSLAPNARAASSSRPTELDREGEGSSRASKAKSRSKHWQEDKQDPSAGRLASRGGSERAAHRMKSQ